MAINVARNKLIGPGGSTRRLHHSPVCGRAADLSSDGLRKSRQWADCRLWGRNRIDERLKARSSLGMVSTASGQTMIVANDNYAEVRLAA